MDELRGWCTIILALMNTTAVLKDGSGHSCQIIFSLVFFIVTIIVAVIVV